MYTRKMRSTLIKGEWLTDEHISLSLTILHDQFPTIEGLQSPLLSQLKKGFQQVPKNSTSIQIHNISNSHWVTSYSEGGKLYVYDSKFSLKNISSEFSHQLASIYISLATTRKNIS